MPRKVRTAKAAKRGAAKRAPAKKAARKRGGGGTTPTRPSPKPADGLFGTVKANSVQVDDSFGGPPRPLPLKIIPAVALDEESQGGVLRLRTKSKVRVDLMPTTDGGRLRLFDAQGKHYAWLGDAGKNDGSAALALRPGGGASKAELWATKSGGKLQLHDSKGKVRVDLMPTTDGGRLRLFDAQGKHYAWLGDAGKNDGSAALALRPGGGTSNAELWAGKNGGWLGLYDGDGNQQIVLDGNAGDILLMNADCAEEFDVVEEDVEPGTVLVLDADSGRLRTSYRAYDSTVAGVVSGAGAYRPGIVLDRKGPTTGRRPVALVGKVFCMVDAASAPVRPGSLLTTAECPGHAMAVVDKTRAFGAVLGKALQGLETGRGLIPILVALQ
ncbi:MAG: hypothetical protein ACRD2X_28020 [Vicinamibacteraceae bacterium]